MDPLTSLSLTCAIVQLVDFSSKLIKGTAEIYGSATGATLQDASLKVQARRLKDLTTDLNNEVSSPSGPLGKNLQELVGECQKLSDQLLRYLEKTAAKDGSLIASATAAWSSLRHKAAKKELQNQLNSCQDQLALHLNALMRSEIKERLESLAQSQELNAQQFASLKRLVGKLREGVYVTSLDVDIKNQLSGLLGLSGRTYDSMRKDRILKSLSFKAMHRRLDEVHPAHVGTFDWILREGSFVDWLSHGHGVFHIAGKPGSGKSTLMRFLCDDSRTQERLKQWAANSRAVCANFFFWRHGESDLQRNLEGLFRGLLHDSLCQCPDLIPDVLPELWKASESSSRPWPTGSDLKLQKHQIRGAFYKMINKRELYCNRRFCFFIDGLDEYKETTREDYRDLVNLLFEWIDIAPQDVKICVSSRELTIFETGRFDLDPNLKLRLHQLTKKDIETLVRDRLSSLFATTEDEERSLDLSLLGREVIERANGVFLWVTLVLQSLRQGWADGDTFRLLLEKVKSMPPELDDLFRDLLKSVAEPNKQRAYLMMAVALRFRQRHRSMPLLFYFFVTEFYTATSANAIENIQPGRANNDERITTARRRVMAYSRGLLEVTKPMDWVLFTHRSVCDFLQQEDVQNLIQEKVDSSDIQKAICLSFVAELRALNDPVLCDAGPILSVCKADWRDNLTPGLLDRIDEELCRIQGSNCRKAMPFATLNNFWPLLDKNDRQKWKRFGSLTCEAGGAGFLKYVKWKMERHPSPLDSDEEAARVFIACMLGWLSSGHPETMRILKLMLDSRLPPNAPGKGWTIWLVVLIALMSYESNLTVWSAKERGDLVEELLLRGAETRISFHLEIKRPRRFERPDGKPGNVFLGGHSLHIYVGEERVFYHVWQPWGQFASPMKHWPQSFTLRDLVGWLRLHNAKRLRAMIDESLGDMSSGIGDCTSENDMPQLTDVSGGDSGGKTWAESLGISGSFLMISIVAACAVVMSQILGALFGTVKGEAVKGELGG